MDKRLMSSVTYLLCDPVRELICCNKCHPVTLGILTPPEIPAETHFHAHHRTKLPHYLYLLIENPFSYYVQIWSTYYHVAQCSQKAPISISSR